MLPNLKGRIFPRQDWEGDDFTPGAKGFVTCNDTAAGRMVAWATNGRVDHDGKLYRSAIVPHDPDGITLDQAKSAVAIVANRTLYIPKHWKQKDMTTHLRYGRGIMVGGWYGAIERAYRYQLEADFYHEIWISHLSATSGYRVWDPLNPDIHSRGRWMPVKMINAFADTLGFQVAYVPLEPL